jgi:hypothetical protein
MSSSPATPRRDGLASRWHGLMHALVIVAGWVIFVGAWWLVLGQPRDTGTLRSLLVGAVLVAPALTIAWVLHNVGIHRRKGPRRAVAAVPLRYEVDFNGRRIEADWPALQRARTVVIERGDGVKRFVCEPEVEPAAPARRRSKPRRSAERADFEMTES